MYLQGTGTEYLVLDEPWGGDVTVTGVTVNHGKIPDGEGYRLSFNYHGNRRGR